MTAQDTRGSGGGCLGKIFGLLVLLLLAGVATAIYTIFQPQDLTDLDGYGDASAGRDLRQVLEDSLAQGYTATVTEADLNRYLRETLAAEQGGLLAERAPIRGVGVRLEEGRAEVIVERELFGRPLTLSMYLRIEQTESPDGLVTTRIFRNGGQYHEMLPRPAVGGRFGRLKVPEGFLLLVLPAFEDLAAVYRRSAEEVAAKEPRRELDCIDEMSRLSIEDGKLVLQSRPDVIAPR